MRIAVQAPVRGAYTTVWSAEMVSHGKVRDRKVFEAADLATLLGGLSPRMEYQVGVLEADGWVFKLVAGRDLRAELRAVVVYATRGSLAAK
jgi:hypothetical protein